MKNTTSGEAPVNMLNLDAIKPRADGKKQAASALLQMIVSALKEARHAA